MIIALIIIDQYTKHLAVLHLKNKPAFSIIDGVFELNYLENRGAAFGMLQNQKGFFILISSIVLIAISYILFKMPEDKKYNIMHILLILIASGAVGNMIDRIRFDFVVDFISFVLINFPIFNGADCFIVIGTISLFILFMFVYKEQDLEFLSFKQNKYREIK